MASQAELLEQFERVAPVTPYGTRIWLSAKLTAEKAMKSVLAQVPGLDGLRKDTKPKLMALTSDAKNMASWFEQPYGTPDKPQSLQEIPWDYVAENQEEVPFFGLREYWYPALWSDELGHNEHKTAELLGDNIVLFRGKDGTPGAIENRCPHRSALMSLGQVNVWEIGTITCRYHGATFDKHGNCVAFLADGPDSPACGKMKAKSYPCEEVGGIIWIYMGEKDPKPFLDSMPHAREVLSDGVLLRNRVTVPYSYLNQLDNVVDMTHVGCLHRTCYIFGDQKMGGGVSYTELPGGGVFAELRERDGHAGTRNLNEIRWFTPNLVHHGPEFMDGAVHGMWFWFVPHNAGSFTGWLIGSFNDKKLGKLKAKAMVKALGGALSSARLPWMACFLGGDAPMQMSQGRIVRWDNEQLVRIDRASLKVRQMMKQAFKEEQEERRKRGLDPLAHRIVPRPKDVE